jgi:hypothetical protein
MTLQRQIWQKWTQPQATPALQPQPRLGARQALAALKQA